MITSAAPSSSGASSPPGGPASRQPSGGASRPTRIPGLSPSLRACGVPVTMRTRYSRRAARDVTTAPRRTATAAATTVPSPPSGTT